MKEEIWKPIKGYEGWYEVSNYGNVRSVDRVVICSDGRKRSHKGMMMKAYKNEDGYLRISLSKSGKVKKVLIHRIVAETFLRNPNNLPEVNHKDENKANNCVLNIEFCSHLYNIRYGTGIQRSAEKRKMLSTKPVVQLDVNTGQVISEYPSINEAARQLNIFHCNISACCKGKRDTAGCFKWKYKE